MPPILFMPSTDSVVQELHGRGVTERGMAASAIVKRFDVVEQITLRSDPRAVAGIFHQCRLMKRQASSMIVSTVCVKVVVASVMQPAPEYCYPPNASL